MNQGIPQTNNNKYACCYFGHEKQEVIGFCLFQSCLHPSPFCLKCVTTDRSKMHESHQDAYCIGFLQIPSLRESALKQLNQTEEDYHILNFQIIFCVKQILNQLPSKCKPLGLKFASISRKIQPIKSILVQRKQLLEEMTISLQQQNYSHFRSNLNSVKSLLCQSSNKKIFQKLSVLLGSKYKNSQQKMVCSNLQSLVEKTLQQSLGKEENFVSLGENLNTKRKIDAAFDLENNWKRFSLGIVGESEDVIQFFDEANRQDPNSSRTQYLKGKYEDSIKSCDDAIRLNSSNSLAYNWKGNALGALGKDEGAIKNYDEAIKWNPKLSNAQCNKSIVLYVMGYCKSAIKCFDQAIGLNPKIVLAFFYKALQKDIRWLPIDIYCLGKLGDAIICYNEIIKQDSNYSYAYKYKGISLFEQGLYLDSINCFNEYIQLKPMDSQTINYKGVALHFLNNYQNAINCYEQAILLNPKFSLAYNNKGFALNALCKYEMAIQCYDEAIQLDKENSWIQNNKGMTLHQMGKYDDAIKYYKMAIENSYYFKFIALNNIGIALHYQRHFDQAIIYFDDAIYYFDLKIPKHTITKGINLLILFRHDFKTLWQG